jgi:hypothetical protein
MAWALGALGATILYNDTDSYMVLINGSPVFVIAGTLTVDGTIGKRSTASFDVRTDTSTHFYQYQQVSIYDKNTTLVFSGYISNPKETKPGYQPFLYHTITCIDQHFLADKRIVTASYTNKTCGFIAQEMVRLILSQEGVSIGQIYDGLTPSPYLYPSPTLYPGGNVGVIPQADFAYARVSDVMDELVKQASASGVPYYWQIDQYKRIYFVPYTSIVNSTLIDGSQIDQIHNPPSVQRQNPTYRNSQIILGGVAQTITQVESRTGDEKTVAWAVGYDIYTIDASTGVIVTTSGVDHPKNVGIRGVDTGKDFYYSQGDNIITQDSGGTKLTSSDTLTVTYIGQYPSTMLTANQAQIDFQKDIDGTSGIFEDVHEDQTLTSAANGFSEASALLTRYGQQGVELQFTTLQAGFAQGQLVTVYLPDFALYNDQMLITDVSAADSDGYNIWYTVTCMEGAYDVAWQDFYSNLLKQPQKAGNINVGISQATSTLDTFDFAYTPSFVLTATVYACPLPGPTLYPSPGLLPC